MKPVQEQFDAIAQVYPGATMAAVEGLQLVVIPTIALPKGWSQRQTHVRFVIPNGYPYAAPDCFWADHALRLEKGQLPKNAQPGNVVPGQPDRNTMWFSWHVQAAWNAATCDLMTYVQVIRSRFESPQ